MSQQVSPEPQKNNPSNELTDFYARLKDVYLELPGFSFFHSPSGRFRDNPKMVGRKRVRKKLYGILTNSETKTGSYIITGFRGVGKTSLVNQVVNELQPRSINILQATYIVLSWLLIHLIFFFLDIKFDWKQINTPIFTAVICSGLLIIIFYTNKIANAISENLSVAKAYHNQMKDKQGLSLKNYEKKHKDNRTKFINRQVDDIKNRVINFFKIHSRYYKRSNAYRLFYFLYYSLIIEILYQLLTFKCDLPINLASLFLVFLLIIITSEISRYVSFNKKEIGIFKYKGKVLRQIRYDQARFFKQLFNHSNKVFVRLSFPQDAIDSKDILKSLVHHLQKEYQRYNGFNRKVAKLSITLIILIATNVVYYGLNMENSINEIKDHSFISEYFPSQKSDYDIKIIDSLKSLNKPILSYYQICFLNEDREIIKYNTATLDYYLNWLYSRVFSFLQPISNILFPRSPDLAFFIILLFGFLIGKMVRSFGRPLGVVSNIQVKKLLQELNEKCLAEVGYGSSTTINTPLKPQSKLSFISFKKSKNLRYPIAGAREIENDLIHMFDELDRIPKFFAPPEFIFIFDELDKLDPSKFNIENEPDEELGSSLESEKVRKRRELVSSIMASMKIFFTTAKAKFVFIAGREMYDASLADSSDRESYLGSIFHDVIYVSSLYKDPFDDHTSRIRKPIDITYLIERYVCKLLIPENLNYPHNLKGYSEYLRSFLRKPILLEDEERDEDIIALKHGKVMNVVSNFIMYIAYRSKGSPMNMLKLIEDFVEEFPHREDDIFNDDEKLIIGDDPKAYYLTFDFQAQYRISFVAGIFRPFAVDTGLYLKKYSDKILVSTSYLLDHIYKFHDFGFSWRNLELLPEIIDINRAPKLRRHIENIINFLSDTYLKKIDNGFTTYKFHRKIIEEIHYLSRKSDTESAIFNFTLDESYSIKKHYERRLKRLLKGYSSTGEIRNFINSIAFLESILGDLHFFDKEYDEAIIQYTDSVQMLNYKADKLSLHETFLLVRTKLKEALVFERMNTYEPAFTKYSELVEINRKHGKFLKEFGEIDEMQRNKSQNNYIFYLYSEIEKSDRRENFHFLKSLYENFSLMTLPILAKLVIIEKISKQGITLKDSLRADKNFHSIINYLKKDEKFTLKLEYHLQKGDILYYKNSVLFKDYKKANEVIKPFDHGSPNRDFNAPISAYNEYIEGLTLYIQKFNKIAEFDEEDEGLDNPRTGKKNTDTKVKRIQKYEGLEIWLDEYRNATESSEKKKKALEILILKHVIQFIRFDKYDILTMTDKMWDLLAKLLSALGDCLLILCNGPSMKNFTNNVESFVRPKSGKIDSLLENNLSRTELAIIYYSCSAVCYKRANQGRNYSFQHKKILFTATTYFTYLNYEELNTQEDSSILTDLKKELVYRIIESLNQNREFIIFPEFSKSKDHKIDITPTSKLMVNENLSDYYKFSYNTEIKLSILHWLELDITHFKSSRYKEKIQIRDILKHSPFSAYNGVNDQMVRMFELRHKSRLNRKIVLNRFEVHFNQTNPKDVKYLDSELNDLCFKFNGNCIKSNKKADLKFLISDSIFCELRIINGINLNDVSYIKSYFYLASAYLSLGWWVELWNILFQLDNKELRDLIGSHELHYIDNPEYAYQKALNNYYETINLHSESDAYKSLLSNMYFTEGDFDDDNQHFCAAIDRFLINNRVIRNRIEFIKTKLREISIFSIQEP
ncbi:MAG: hypothetical protein AAF149_18150 [Bacteroidota bacterium]